ncbi:hypothetical protein GGR52DRAFT_76402 [Hypoxylon sp. FL1284]|nr:hypothetical protein GGR52DRAFT_76402 [Hypoxylon sp. FL1284]
MPPKPKGASKAKGKENVRAPAPPRRRQGTNEPRRSRVGAAASLSRRAEEQADRAAERVAAHQEIFRRCLEESENIEAPTDPLDDLRVLPKTHTASVKRSVNAAFDDRGKNKRLKFFLNDEDDPSSPPFPWEMDEKLEQPPSPLDLDVRPESLTLDPQGAIGDLGKLPAEVRDKILGYLLVSEEDIRTLKGWSCVYPRNKPNLDVAILRTCSVLYLQGLRILFGENTFLYDIRDPGDHMPQSRLMMNKVYDKCKVPIDKYGHLVRHIKIHVDANRLTHQNMVHFTKAVQKFLPGSGLSQLANIHTLTLDIPVLTQDELKRAVPVWDFLGDKFKECIYTLSIQFIRIIATMPKNDLPGSQRDRYEHVIDLRYLHKQKQEQGQHYDQTQDQECPAVKKRFQAMVNTGKSRVYNIPIRVWELTVLGPQKANMKKCFWTLLEQVEKPTLGGQSLPNNWRDRPTSGSRHASKNAAEDSSPRKRLANLTTSLSKKEATEKWLEGIESEDPEGEDPMNGA